MDHDGAHAAVRAGAYHHGDLRIALLEAAEAMLEESGVESFTLRGAARRVGVSHAAPAHHFGDARGLLTELAAIGFTRLSQAMLDAVAVYPGDRLLAIGMGYIRFAIDKPAVFSLMWRTDRLDVSRPSYRGPAGKAFEILRSTMAGVYEAQGRSIDRGAFDADVRLAWSTVHGLGTLINAGHLGRKDGERPSFAVVEPWAAEVVARMAEAIRLTPGRAASSDPGSAPAARCRSG